MVCVCMSMRQELKERQHLITAICLAACLRILCSRHAHMVAKTFSGMFNVYVDGCGLTVPFMTSFRSVSHSEV